MDKMGNVDWNIAATAITAVISSIVAWLFTRHLTKGSQATTINALEVQLISLKEKNVQLETQHNLIQNDLEKSKVIIDQLKDKESQLLKIHDVLKRAGVATTYHQPVVLVGPRSVGKTSLLTQWNAPWNHAKLTPTTTYKMSHVPIHDFIDKDLKPHFACPEFLTQNHVHLALKLFDFPGELSYQEKICEIIVKETEQVKQNTG